jgi:hypothetical protein
VGREEAKRIASPGRSESPWEWDGVLPADSGYIRLPRNLFWTSPDAAGEPSAPSRTAEGIDGVFWTLSAGKSFSLALVAGIVAGRPGFTIFELPPVPLADAPAWSGLQVRREGADFATALPGGELGGLHSILELGEVLKLVSRVFALHAGRGSGTRDDVSSTGDQGEGRAEDEVAR